jgi:hypothetical protein
LADEGDKKRISNIECRMSNFEVVSHAPVAHPMTQEKDFSSRERLRPAGNAFS